LFYVTNDENCWKDDSSRDPSICNSLILSISKENPYCDYKNRPEFLSRIEHTHSGYLIIFLYFLFVMLFFFLSKQNISLLFFWINIYLVYLLFHVNSHSLIWIHLFLLSFLRKHQMQGSWILWQIMATNR